MYCTECGEKLPEESLFCPNCGARVEDEPEGARDAEGEAAASEHETGIRPAIELPVIGPEVPDEPAEQPVEGERGQAAQEAAVTPAAAAALVGKQPLSKSVKTRAALVAAAAAIAIVVAVSLLSAQGNRTVDISFETDGGSVVSAEEVRPGEQVTSPENPTKTGYSFDGWYADPQLTQKVSFPYQAPDEDTVMYAKWAEASEESETQEANADTDSDSDSTDSAEEASASESSGGSKGGKKTSGVKRLKAYFKSLKSANRKFHDFSQDDFNPNFTKGAETRSALGRRLDSLKGDIYDELATGYEGSWTVSEVEIPEGWDGVKEGLEEASDLLVQRWDCMDAALEAVNELPESSSESTRASAGQEVLKDKNMNGLYKRYEKLESSLSKDLK